MIEVTRRQFLLGAGMTAAASTSPSLVETASKFNTFITASGRSELPERREVIRPNSVLLGISPHNNHFVVDPMFQIVNIFPQWDSDWGKESIRAISARGQIPMISLGPTAIDQKSPFRFPTIEQQEQSIRQKAASLKDMGPILVRFAYEMNGEWFPYGSHVNTPTEFIAAWKKVVGILRDTVPNVKCVFCPNVLRPIAPYFPGSEWVDIVALDGYDKYSPNIFDPRHLQPNLTFGQLFGPDIKTLQKLAPQTPIMIAETGTARGDGAGRWLREALVQAASYKGITAVCLFSWNKESPFSFDEANWDITGNPNIWQAIRSVREGNVAFFRGDGKLEESLPILLNRD